MNVAALGVTFEAEAPTIKSCVSIVLVVRLLPMFPEEAPTPYVGGAVIGSKAGILPGKIVRPGVWWGIPIQPLDEYKRMNAHMNRLPQMRDEIKRLEKEIEELKKKINT